MDFFFLIMGIDRTACCIPQLAPNELYDAPSILTTRCIADSDDIMQKFGAAGAGKSAITKRIAGVSRRKKKKEGTTDRRLFLLQNIINSRRSRSSCCNFASASAFGRYQFPTISTRTHIEDAIKRDPAIFNFETSSNLLIVSNSDGESLSKN